MFLHGTEDIFKTNGGAALLGSTGAVRLKPNLATMKVQGKDNRRPPFLRALFTTEYFLFRASAGFQHMDDTASTIFVICRNR